MANTSDLSSVFDWVRSEMGTLHHTSFEKRAVRLRPGVQRTFNAVSTSGSVVATIMNASGTTSGGKKPTGKVRGAIAELYYLTCRSPHATARDDERGLLPLG